MQLGSPVALVSAGTRLSLTVKVNVSVPANPAAGV